jgi:hypothetical protein
VSPARRPSLSRADLRAGALACSCFADVVPHCESVLDRVEAYVKGASALAYRSTLSFTMLADESAQKPAAP